MNFAVEINGFVDAGFETCQGLHDRASAYNVTECNQQSRKKIFPYERKVGALTLTKGVSFEGEMENWYYETIGFRRGGKSPRRDVSVVQLYRLPKSVPLLGNQLIEVKRWNIPNCVCHDLTFPKFRALSGKEISILESMIECTTPEQMEAPTNFGQVGRLIDALM
jgi:phage tail-like protein